MTATRWDLDLSHSSIDFTIRHLVVSKVRGRFNKWAGELRYDEKHPERSSIEVRIDAASIDTAEPQRDAHLRAPDFFDVERFPTLTFRSTRVERRGDDKLAVTGDLTIRDQTRPVTLEVELGGTLKDPWGKQRAGFTARTTIDRKEFGLTFNQVLDHGGLALGDTVTIGLDVEATRAVETTTATAPAPASAPAA